MVGKQPLDRDQLESVALIFNALAEPSRLLLLQALQKGPLPVGTLAKRCQLKQANASKQLGLLHKAGLVSRSRAGNVIHYAIRDPMIFELCGLVCGKIRRDATDLATRFRITAAKR